VAFISESRQVSWLTAYIITPSHILGCSGICVLTVYSDEFAQDLHLFPFSLELFKPRYPNTGIKAMALAST